MMQAQHVLVVDDCEDSRDIVAMILRAEGYVVAQAEDGHAALQHLRAAAVMPALVVTDLEMPKMDGWTLLQRLRKNEATYALPIVVMSGAAPIGIPDDVPFLAKPVGSRALLDAVGLACACALPED